jgi:hypothetical protein
MSRMLDTYIDSIESTVWMLGYLDVDHWNSAYSDYADTKEKLFELTKLHNAYVDYYNLNCKCRICLAKLEDWFDE